MRHARIFDTDGMYFKIGRAVYRCVFVLHVLLQNAEVYDSKYHAELLIVSNSARFKYSLQQRHRRACSWS